MNTIDKPHNAQFASFIFGFVFFFSFILCINNNASVHDNAWTATNTHTELTSWTASIFRTVWWMETISSPRKGKKNWNIFIVIPDFEFQKLQYTSSESWTIWYRLLLWRSKRVPSVFCVPDWRHCTPNYVTDLSQSIFVHFFLFSSFASSTILVVCFT